jgi:hypothetical protein
MLKELVPLLQDAALKIADMFPFFEDIKTNSNFNQEDKRSTYLMSLLLSNLMSAYKFNKTNADSIKISHSNTAILYQVYEADTSGLP